MPFEFATAARIRFGPGSLREAPAAAAEFGRRCLVVASSEKRVAPLVDLLQKAGLEVIQFFIHGEPTTDSVLEGVRLGREFQPDGIIGMGGGSALDAAKAIAAFVTNPGEVLDYLEVIGKGQTLVLPSVPCIAIPTTAGTGTEVTRNAVLVSPDHRLKVSLRSPTLLPRLALVDPELTVSMPPDVTAATGMDALTQLIEPFVSNASNPMTDALCREGIHRAALALLRAYRQPAQIEARQEMSLASLFGGMALANARLGAVHGFAAVIGGMYPAPHGAVCAHLLPIVMAVNIRALNARAENTGSLDRYKETAQLLTANPRARPEDGVQWVRELTTSCGIRTLGEYGLKVADFPEVVAQAKRSSSIRGNPIQLTDTELTTILTEAV